jgi:hypothetical protein
MCLGVLLGRLTARSTVCLFIAEVADEFIADEMDSSKPEEGDAVMTVAEDKSTDMEEEVKQKDEAKQKEDVKENEDMKEKEDLKEITEKKDKIDKEEGKETPKKDAETAAEAAAEQQEQTNPPVPGGRVLRTRTRAKADQQQPQQEQQQEANE